MGVDSQDRLYVLTRGTHPVVALDREGHFLESWGDEQFVRPHGLFITPHDVCVDPNGTVYVADRLNLRIQVFTSHGQFVSEWRDVRWPNAMCPDAQAQGGLPSHPCLCRSVGPGTISAPRCRTRPRWPASRCAKLTERRADCPKSRADYSLTTSPLSGWAVCGSVFRGVQQTPRQAMGSAGGAS
ncbi:MAG: hypothetical protein FJ011_25315 [Chloroflexi bacterium]|nr:hypothetical protein [Chloroflexota bacterium]